MGSHILLKMSSAYEETVKAMRSKALEFDRALSKVKRLNDELVIKAQQALQSIGELMGCVRNPTNPKCTVCVTRELGTILIPCGHAFCTSCAGRAERTRCHTCRARIDSTMRIFI